MFDPISEIDILRCQPGDIIVAYFNWHEFSVTTAKDMHNSLKEIAPKDVTVVTIPDDTYLVDYSQDQYIQEMLGLIDQNVDRNKYIQALRAELSRIDGDDLK